MPIPLTTRITQSGVISASICLSTLALIASPARADNLIGFYVGGAVGQGRVEAGSLSSPAAVIDVVPTVGNFKENHAAYKVIVGVRPISLVGAELSYIDFGKPDGTIGTGSVGEANASAQVKLKGAAAFAMLYLPIPIIDVYLKAGVARLQTNANTSVTLTGPLCLATFAVCQFAGSAKTNSTGGAAGVGVQYKFAGAAVRAEYERFSVSGGNPGLFSVGFTWTF